MKILHGTWIPDAHTNFVQTGAFYLWVETAEKTLQKKALSLFLEEELGFPRSSTRDFAEDISDKFFELPTADGIRLPSVEMARYLEIDLPESFEWQTWPIACYRVGRYFKGGQSLPGIRALLPQLKELHFIAQYQLADVQLGADLLFWFHYTQAFKQVILRDHYIPSLRYRKVGKKFETYPHWEIVSEAYESMVQRYLDHMPLVCAAGFAAFVESSDVRLHDPETLLRHCSECLLHDVVTRAPLPQSFYKQIEGSLVYSCLKSAHWTTSTQMSLYKQWRPWRDRVARTQSTVPFYLCFQLESPTDPDDDWRIHFKVAPKAHPSLRISLQDYWQLKPYQQMALKLQLGDSFEQDLLFALGDAARIYPPMWDGLETDQPSGILLDVDAAFDFLNEAAWV
ncbi:MAG: ATP-dependent helicase, partial [Cyanobacteria bacterium P01_C01_bin.121]